VTVGWTSVLLESCQKRMQILEYDLVGKVEELRRLEKVLPFSLSLPLALSLSLSSSLSLSPAVGRSE
jgi:hypothetical protein